MTLKLSYRARKVRSMKIRTLANRRASWRAHFLAIAREAQAPDLQPFKLPRAGLKPRVRALAPDFRSRVMPAATAA